MTSNYVVENGDAQVMSSAKFAELIEAVLGKGAPFRFQANGLSMFPFIRDGDILTIAPKPKNLRLGNVVVFVNPGNGRLTVHRIIGIDRNNYEVRGDNCPKADGAISHADILGHIAQVEHRGRRVWLGLGIERIAIALLSSRGWLISLMIFIHRIYHFIFKRNRS